MTPGQERVLLALRRLTNDGTGWPATLREVADETGLASAATALVHLEALERQGHALRHPRRPSTGGWMAQKP